MGDNPTGGAPHVGESTPESRPSKRGRIECSYCNCVLDSEGEIITMGKRAKEFRAMSENDETRLARIESLEGEVKELKVKLAASEKTPETVSAASNNGGEKKSGFYIR